MLFLACHSFEHVCVCLDLIFWRLFLVGFLLYYLLRRESNQIRIKGIFLGPFNFLFLPNLFPIQIGCPTTRTWQFGVIEFGHPIQQTLQMKDVSTGCFTTTTTAATTPHDLFSDLIIAETNRTSIRHTSSRGQL